MEIDFVRYFLYLGGTIEKQEEKFGFLSQTQVLKLRFTFHCIDTRQVIL